MKSKSEENEIIHIIKSYVSAGKLLHMMTLLEIGLVLIMWPKLTHIAEGESLYVIMIKCWILIYLISLPFFSQLDARSRFQNYKQIKDQLFLYGFDERIFKPILKSRCQRDAAWLSAHELGLGKNCKAYFYAHGYRWFHLFPDFVFSKPLFLLTPYFWKTTFFTPHYASKIDYSKVEKRSISSFYTTTSNIPYNAS